MFSTALGVCAIRRRLQIQVKRLRARKVPSGFVPSHYRPPAQRRDVTERSVRRQSRDTSLGDTRKSLATRSIFRSYFAGTYPFRVGAGLQNVRQAETWRV